MSICVIEYGMGNIKSVVNAFKEIGTDVFVANSPNDLKKAEAIVLPGVGAFKQGMDNLNKLGMIDQLNDEVLNKKKCFLGICLGMQLLAEKGFEHGENDGLGWLPGTIVKLNPDNKKYHRIPHMGWNEILYSQKCVLFDGLNENPVFYFVHSYQMKIDQDNYNLVTSTSWHGEKITSSVHSKNIYGVQFHPEKSQRAGLKLLHNFITNVVDVQNG